MGFSLGSIGGFLADPIGSTVGAITGTPSVGGIAGNILNGPPQAPPPPDYTGAANAQGEQNQAVNAQQTAANRPDQTTPFGTSTWTSSAGVDPATGTPITNWAQNISLDPSLQSALDSQTALQGGRSALAGDMMDRVANDFSTPFDFSGAPAAGTAASPTTGPMNADDFSAQRDQYINQLRQQKQPEHDIQTEQTSTMLANQGLTPGSDDINAVTAGNTLQQQMNAQKLATEGQQFGQESTQFGQQNQARQQSIAEEAQKRGMSLNEMNALLSGQQVNEPQMPSFQGAAAATPAPIFPAAVAQGNYALGAAGINQAAYGSQMQGLGQLGGMAAMAMM